MEENVALKPDKQKKFVKSIKGIKKLIQSNKVKKIDDDKSVRSSIRKAKKIPRKSKGLVYLSRIPHGFYEEQMTDYFKQFGRVTNARVIRSRRTGKSKSHAFIEFSDTKVAQIVAETMNNYLMGKRLLKAIYIEPAKQRKAFRKKWNIKDNPGETMRRAMKRSYNKDKTENEELKRSRALMKNISKTQEKLSAMGIDYSFFNPVDIPKQLLKIELEDAKNTKTNPKTSEKKIKKLKKITEKEIKLEPTNKKVLKPFVNKKEIKPLGEFVKIKESEDGSDSDDGSVDFDSDQFEQLIEDVDDEFNSSDETGSEAVDSDSDEAEEKPKLVKKSRREFVTKNKPLQVIPVKQNKIKRQGKPVQTKATKVEKKKFEKKNTKGKAQIKKKK